MVGYQVSNQCMGLVRDVCLLPTKDAPELGFVKESSEKQYVPDVLYKVNPQYFYTFLLPYLPYLCKLKETSPDTILFSMNILKFQQKDEYGNEVTRLARPLPVEYLLVDVPVSMPKEPRYTFAVRQGVTSFPVENRLLDGQIQVGFYLNFNHVASLRNSSLDMLDNLNASLTTVFLGFQRTCIVLEPI